MTPEEIAIQLWEYIDGTCNDADRLRISTLIATDAEWKNVYEELMALNAGIKGSVEMEQPSMRFTKNVMDAVGKAHIVPATRQRINLHIIRGIAAFFIFTIVSVLGYAFANANWDSGSDGFFSKLNLDSFLSGSFLNTFIMVNIVLGLVLVDALLRRKNYTNSKPNI